MTGTTVEQIREGFHYPTLDRQPGLPSYNTINSVHTLLKTNAASVPSQLGGGQHGLLGLVLNNDIFQKLTGTDFIKPSNPGTVATIPTGSTGPQIDNLVRNHKEQLREWQETTRTDQALQQQLIAVFDEEYLRGLRNMHTGYVGVTTQQMLDHLYDNYGIITAVDIEDNDTRMREPYNPTFPIETLFHQIELAVEYTTAGKRPYQEDQVVSRAYLLVLRTGLYAEACRDWDKKTLADKKWSRFKTYFTVAHRDLRLMQTASKQAGFGSEQGMNMRQDDVPPGSDDNDDAHGIAAIITDLAQSASEDKETINSAFTTMTATIKALQEKIEAMEKGSSRKRNNNNKSYCWSHGRTRNNNHLSSTCINKKPGHQDDATLANRKGGSDRFCNE